MQLNPSEISDLIKARIQNFDAATEARNTGTIVSLQDGIVRVHGLSDALQGEMLEFPADKSGAPTFGLALNLERDSVGAVVLGDYKHLKEGDTVKTTGRILEVPIGPGLLGRVVDALGRPIDGKGPITAAGTSPIEKIAPGVIARQSVDQPVQTGYKAVDAMIPVGRGQRELIIGDRQTGKTALAIDAIINQKSTGVKCASTSPSARRRPRSPTSCASSNRTTRWPTPSSSPLRRPKPPRCSTSRRTPAARWANTSVTAAKTR